MTAAPIPLPAIPTADSITACVPPAIYDGLAPIIDLWTDAANWTERAPIASVLCRVLVEGGADDLARFRIEAGRRVVTALLEQLGERDLACMDQAALYLASVHVAWRQAAGRFIAGVPDTDLNDWLNRRPELFEFAGRCHALDLPAGVS
jgi:hypothetical protein